MKEYRNFDLTNYNAYKVKSICSIAYFPNSEEELLIILKNRKNNYIIIGNGNNIILSKSYYDSNYLFIIISEKFGQIILKEDDLIYAKAGTNIKELSSFALNHSLSGLEIFYDIPGTVGGIVFMNAGAFGENISSIIDSVDYFDAKINKIKTAVQSDLRWSYRESFFKVNNSIILGVNFWLKKGKYQDILHKMQEKKKERDLKQPKDFPNAGSVFKRPKGFYVGKLIEDCDLKGFSIGGAKISEKHAGFIINYNNATGKDIIALIKYIQRKVYDKFKIELELEQRII